jgi:hypothetical protein
MIPTNTNLNIATLIAIGTIVLCNLTLVIIIFTRKDPITKETTSNFSKPKNKQEEQ